MTLRTAFIQKWILETLVFCSSLLWAANENLWLGKILTDVAVAKQYAYENNRPLLVEVGHANCDHCQNFSNNIFNTTDFKQFAAENRIVLLSMQSKSDASRTYHAFKNDFIYTGNVFPFLMMFHVLDDADLNSRVLDKTQVELCTITWDTAGRKTALKYPDVSATVLGVSISPEALWNPTECIALVEKFFPNDLWESITPIQEPEGYEDALDLGRIWDDDHIPMRNGAYYDADWTQRYNAPSQSGANPLFWFKFIGHQGVRYFFETQNPKVNSTQNYTFTAEMFDTRDGKPVSPALGTITSTNFDTLANGFWFNAPAGSATDQVYYLRIQGEGGATDGTASFTLRYHEEHSNPVAGTLTNPFWTGAKLGQWTMDYDAALAASRKDGKPVIFYFAAVHWCPHCTGWEHLALSTPAFARRSANYYLVVFDSRRRNGSGPALMMDNQKGGYRKTWNISDADAAAKLADTRTVEVALSRGMSPTADYPDGRIGYPTFLFLRAIEGDGPLYPGLDVVARAGGVWTGEDDVNVVFDVLEELYAADYAESQQFPEAANPNTFTQSGQTLTARLAGADPTFVRAAVVPGKFWRFDVPAVEGCNVNATLTIWNEDGTTALSTRTFPLEDGGHIIFVPDDDASKQIWCSFDMDEIDDPIAVPLTATLDDITDTVTFSERDAYLFRTANGSVQLPVVWNSLVSNTPGIALAYQLTATGDAADCIDVGTFTFDWPVEAGCTTTLPIPIHVPAALADWEGTLDFTVTLLPPENDVYVVQDPSSINVRITATPLFPQEESENFQFPNGVYSEGAIPVCSKDNPTVTVHPLPQGMSVRWDAEQGIILYGIPKQNASNVSATVTVDGVPHAFRWTVFESENRVLSVKNVGGQLADNALAGSFLLTNQADGSVAITLTTAEGTRLGTAIGWENGSKQDTLALICTWADGTTLRLEANDDGFGTGTLTDANGDETNATLFVPLEDATPFVGRYHVAYRIADNNEGFSRGWTILDVDADGLVSYEVQMYDDTTATGTALLQAEANENRATLSLFADLQDGRFLSASLLLLSSNSVAEGEPAVLEGDYSTVWFHGAKKQSLTATGVLYDASRTLAEVAEDNSFTFLVELPDLDVPIFVPNILVQEQGDTIIPAKASLLATQFQSFQINRGEGSFQGSFQFLTGEGLLESHTVTFQGILTPISPECCGVSDAVGCAYGYYTYQGQNYAICLLPDAYSRALPPQCTVVAHNGNNITWSIQSSGGVILYKRLLDNSYYGFVWDGFPTEVVLDGTSPYDIVALDEFCVESEIVHLDLQCGEEMTVYPAMATPGWNMIAIPWDVLVAEKQKPEIPCFTLDPVNNCYVRASFLERGQAYWVFTTDGSAKLTFTGVSYPARPELDVTTLADGWQMLAWDDALLQASPNAFIWNGSSFNVDATPKQNQPVMLFIEKSPRSSHP